MDRDEADGYVYFNNDPGGAAVIDSAEFAALARAAEWSLRADRRRCPQGSLMVAAPGAAQQAQVPGGRDTHHSRSDQIEFKIFLFRTAWVFPARGTGIGRPGRAAGAG